MKEIWKESKYDTKDKALNACIILLAMCASSDVRVRVGMKKAFWRLEHDQNLLKDEETFISFWEKEKKFLIVETTILIFNNIVHLSHNE